MYKYVFADANVLMDLDRKSGESLDTQVAEVFNSVTAWGKKTNATICFIGDPGYREDFSAYDDIIPSTDWADLPDGAVLTEDQIQSLMLETGCEPYEVAWIGSGENARLMAERMAVDVYDMSSRSGDLMEWLNASRRSGSLNVRTREGICVPVRFLGYYASKFSIDKLKLSPETRGWRQCIFEFKDGNKEAADYVEPMVTDQISRLAGHPEELAFVCLPASSAANYEERFRRFSADICRKLGMTDGFEHVHIRFDREPKRENQDVDIDNYSVDAGWFRGRKVVLFDDIVTRGGSIALMTKKLREAGAEVLFAVTLGKTMYQEDPLSLHPFSLYVKRDCAVAL